jgi:hypothetical protein
MRRAFLSGNSRSLMTVFILAALATLLALFVFLGTKPAAAQDKAASGATVNTSPRFHCFACDAIVEREPTELRFGRTRVNRTKLRDVTVRGIQDGATFGIHFGGMVDVPRISGSGSGAYSIANNGCSNQELSPEETCIITIAFKPPQRGRFEATLTIPPKPRTQFIGGSNTVRLIGRGVRRLG